MILHWPRQRSDEWKKSINRSECPPSLLISWALSGRWWYKALAVIPLIWIVLTLSLGHYQHKPQSGTSLSVPCTQNHTSYSCWENEIYFSLFRYLPFLDKYYTNKIFSLHKKSSFVAVKKKKKNFYSHLRGVFFCKMLKSCVFSFHCDEIMK